MEYLRSTAPLVWLWRPPEVERQDCMVSAVADICPAFMSQAPLPYSKQILYQLAHGPKDQTQAGDSMAQWGQHIQMASH